MSNDDVKRFDILQLLSPDEIPKTVIRQGGKYVFAADHDRVVAELKQEIAAFTGDLSTQSSYVDSLLLELANEKGMRVLDQQERGKLNKELATARAQIAELNQCLRLITGIVPIDPFKFYEMLKQYKIEVTTFEKEEKR